MRTQSTGRASVMIAGSAAVLLALTSCGGDNSVEAYCDVLEEHGQALDDLESLDNPMEVLGEGMTALAEMMDEAAEVAPDEIQEETEALGEAFDTIANMDLDMSEMMNMDEAELEEMEQQFNELEEQFGDLDATAETWGAYVEENCDVEGL